jgi:hypothetical protein
MRLYVNVLSIVELAWMFEQVLLPTTTPTCCFCCFLLPLRLYRSIRRNLPTIRTIVLLENKYFEQLLLQLRIIVPIDLRQQRSKLLAEDRRLIGLCVIFRSATAKLFYYLSNGDGPPYNKWEESVSNTLFSLLWTVSFCFFQHCYHKPLCNLFAQAGW